MPLEILVFLDPDHQVQVAGRPSLTAAFALTGHAQAVAFIDPGREGHFDFFVFVDPSLAAAFFAGMVNDLAAAPAGRAGSGHGKKALRDADIARAAAFGANIRLRTRFASRTVALMAVPLPFDGDLLFHPQERLLPGSR